MLALEREEWETFKYLFHHPAIDRTAGDKTNGTSILWMAFDKRHKNREIFEKVIFSGDSKFNYNSTGESSPAFQMSGDTHGFVDFQHRKI